MDRLLAYAFSLGEMNSAGRFHSRIRQLTLNTVAIYSAIWAAQIHFLRCQPPPQPPSNQILCGKVARFGDDFEVNQGKEESLLPLPSRCLPFPTHLSFSPSSLPPPQPLPVAWGIPRTQSGRRESPTSLAAALHSLSLAAEPFGDNFDGHNDDGGNHFNEDQSLLKAVELLLPRLRPTLP